MTLEKIGEVIKTGIHIGILPHIDGDGDCIGSSFALLLALKKLGKNAKVVVEEDIPPVYSFLPGQYTKSDELSAEDTFDMIICLDSGDEGRIKDRLHLLHNSKVTVNIDHHITNTKFAQHNYVDPDSAATGEIIYDLIRLLGIEIDREIAANLYVAIATDTGGFRYSNTTSRTHHIVANLLQADIDIASINRKVFETVTLSKLKLLSDAANRIELYGDGKIAFIALTREFIKEAGANDDDTDGLASLPRTVEGVEVGILLTEKEPQKVKVSFRSNEYVDVSEIASLFGGGGHMRASGCTLKTDMKTAKAKVLEAVKDSMRPTACSIHS